MWSKINWDDSWSQEELKEQLAIKRERKVRKDYRIPKKRFGIRKLKTAVKEKTGFQSKDIDIVIKAVFETIRERMEEGEAVRIPNFGLFYLEIIPPRFYISGMIKQGHRVERYRPPHLKPEYVPDFQFLKKSKETHVSAEKLKEAYFTEEEVLQRAIRAEKRLKKSIEYYAWIEKNKDKHEQVVKALANEKNK